jgi:hypothetical protein
MLRESVRTIGSLCSSRYDERCIPILPNMESEARNRMESTPREVETYCIFAQVELVHSHLLSGFSTMKALAGPSDVQSHGVCSL